MISRLDILGALVPNGFLFAVIGTTLSAWIGQLSVAAAGVYLLIAAVRLFSLILCDVRNGVTSMISAARSVSLEISGLLFAVQRT